MSLCSLVVSTKCWSSSTVFTLLPSDRTNAQMPGGRTNAQTPGGRTNAQTTSRSWEGVKTVLFVKRLLLNFIIKNDILIFL